MFLESLQLDFGRGWLSPVYVSTKNGNLKIKNRIEVIICI